MLPIRCFYAVLTGGTHRKMCEDYFRQSDGKVVNYFLPKDLLFLYSDGIIFTKYT